MSFTTLPVSRSKWKAHIPNGIFHPKFCLPLAQFQTRWVFLVNGKQARVLKISHKLQFKVKFKHKRFEERFKVSFIKLHCFLALSINFEFEIK